MQIEDIKSPVDYLIYSKNEIHGYSRAIGKLFDLSTSYISDAEKAYKEGKKVIWSRTNGWEVPLAYSCGIIPVAFSEMGRLSDFETMRIGEEYYQFPPETCSMVKCTVGQWHKRKSKSINRILGAGVACEPFNLALELMKQAGYDVHTVDVIYRAPGMKGDELENLVEFFIRQIYDTVEWLTGSRKIDEDKLKQEIQRKNQLISKVRKILELRIGNPFYMRSLPAIFLLTGLNAGYFGKPEEYEKVLDLLIEELENAPVNEEDLKRVIPLVWVGNAGQEFGVFEVIDQADGALLGFRGYPFNICREDIPPVEALARHVLGNQDAGASVYVQQVLEKEAQKVNARGLILYGYLGCSYSTIAREMWGDHFRKQGIPSINLEGTFQIGPPSGQILTRIKAFTEMLA
ncbi:MAG TPA: 2-hydroxyacyl-CoA dehydratase family protein [Methylomusa anaerophila]|uniref:2-hydroxyglutaryl-CoA dehydratase, D-component n=1 Tax=Methylomusa anaerophila TaxID=1930071 RepID=A0A348AIL1_9FIRM|nr:2-hydroxyacyl-CoA dehydratase family protein [Methylomusa anaerophila]BBB90909.1 2-hydroxyglutaryl-CoA dehydratase, D-component [Methylomusa anaerophila]HML90685.1 2-hydroxyacyl-CoA dehydratase family protein [Methylomusa anaerophila]